MTDIRLKSDAATVTIEERDIIFKQDRDTILLPLADFEKIAAILKATRNEAAARSRKNALIANFNGE